MAHLVDASECRKGRKGGFEHTALCLKNNFIYFKIANNRQMKTKQSRSCNFGEYGCENEKRWTIIQSDVVLKV